MSIILTHTGKLGDFIYTFPIANALYKQGHRVHWVLAKSFAPFTKIESLLRLQPFTEDVTLCGVKVDHHRRGGQPYKFNPADFGVRGEYFNLGFRNYPGRGFMRWKTDLPDKYIPLYYAEEHGLPVDDDFTLELGTVEQTDEILCTIRGLGGFRGKKEWTRHDPDSDLLDDARRFKAARERHCWFSSIAAILYFARVPFYLHKHYKERTHLYFPDNSRYTLRWHII